MYQDQYMKWCLESVTVPRHSFIRPELIVEPSVPSYPVEPLPRTEDTDWLAELRLSASTMACGMGIGNVVSSRPRVLLVNPSAAASAGGGNDGSSASEAPPVAHASPPDEEEKDSGGPSSLGLLVTPLIA
ncbi:hypothetical protein GQ600_10092 [Phytophthora cactorum]|nr:hypothetical protein GQ600_10092 [Phytophthora cactorum]